MSIDVRAETWRPMACAHSLRSRPLASTSIQSASMAPVFADELCANGSSHSAERGAPEDLNICQCYLLCTAIRLGPIVQRPVSRIDCDTVGDPGGMTPFLELCLSKRARSVAMDAAAESLRLAILWQAPAGDGQVRGIDLRDPSVSRALRRADSWCVVAAVREVGELLAAIPTLRSSRVVLPIYCGKAVRTVCIVGSRTLGSGSSEALLEAPKLGWYNSKVRTMRVPLDLCLDCYRWYDTLAHALAW